MPQLYRDFVVVARNLGVRYISIDSLCIIHDSAKDWEYKASRMCTVYSASICTVSTVNAQSGAESLFTNLHPLITKYLVLSNPDNGLTKTRYGRYDSGVDLPKPLYIRAWVL
ncbi:hypothetical protein DM02DRAFT_691188 [Periconia macrospinosa]|uniref:Heterokaryon incompatibility domain-containing protein n=1 Tax=Periconia macrospinosa TaxID=97972 RepID=A0A2V1DAV3_9PLEO|nr:hypothetical protein DM02DRAFT_691188 [Periconia macrospinosa]